MWNPPATPKIYHITHVDNLRSIINEGGLRPDSALIARGGVPSTIGMTSIKERRLQLPVSCHPGDHVADYVPFYFCPRSVMLFLIYKVNHPELTYKGGQGPIVHLEADLSASVAWADQRGWRWAFSLSNAGARYTQFRSDLNNLNEINWPAVAATDFRPSDIKEGKQAEFLMRGGFPWQLVSRIGIYSQEIALRAYAALDTGPHRPTIEFGRIGIFESGFGVIEYKTGDILAEDAEALVNTVNCVGIMGRGIALQFKNAYPENFKFYKQACDHQQVQPGRMLVFENNRLSNPRYIINFPTKRHWRGKSRIEDIDSGLRALVDEITQRKIRSIAIPPLGSGLGGLDWAVVRPRIERALSGLQDLEVIVYEPKGAPDARDMRSSSNVPKMTPGKAALIVLLDRYLAGLLDPFVSLLEIHKLMYFMQEAGQVLRLRYQKAPYGPYADNLRHVLKEIEGHWIMGYADGGDAPDKQLELVPGAVDDALAALAEDQAARERFDRVAQLVEGFETPFGLELLATVHWIVIKGGAQDPRQVIEQTYSWGERKRQFSESQIKLALQVLSSKRWIAAAFQDRVPVN